LGGGDIGDIDLARALALQPDGKIVVAASTTTGTTTDFTVARFTAEGLPDYTYATGVGWSRLDFGPIDEPYALALQPDGKILVAGWIRVGAIGAQQRDGVVARLNNPEGTLDSSYGGGSGWSRLDFGFGDEAHALALQPDGKILVAGVGGPGGDDFVVARLKNPDGTLDGS